MSFCPVHKVGTPVSVHSGLNMPGLLSPTMPTTLPLLGLYVVNTPFNIAAYGFQIGFHRGSLLQSTSSNLQSATAPKAVDDFLQKKLAFGCIVSQLLDTSHMPTLQINRIQVVPKGYNTGKWRLITDLSHPSGLSINDGIGTQLYSLS